MFIKENSNLYNMLLQMERFKMALLKQIAEEKLINHLNFSAPKYNLKPIYIKDSPVFQFVYAGTLPLYNENGEYIQHIRNYYSIMNSLFYDFETLNIQFEKATLIIEHCFSDKMIRDLDNRNRKYVIDGIRYTGLIQDDDIQHLKIFETGEQNQRYDCVHVLLLAQSNFKEVLSELPKLRDNIPSLYFQAYSELSEMKEIWKVERQKVQLIDEVQEENLNQMF